MLALFRRDSTETRRVEAASDLSATALERNFEQNAIASLMAQVAAGLLIDRYAKSMTELQQGLAKFDGARPSQPVLQYSSLNAADISNVNPMLEARRRFDELFGEERLSYGGGEISKSAHQLAIESDLRRYEREQKQSQRGRSSGGGVGRIFCTSRSGVLAANFRSPSARAGAGSARRLGNCSRVTVAEGRLLSICGPIRPCVQHVHEVRLVDESLVSIGREDFGSSS